MRKPRRLSELHDAAAYYEATYDRACQLMDEAPSLSEVEAVLCAELADKLEQTIRAKSRSSIVRAALTNHLERRFRLS